MALFGSLLGSGLSALGGLLGQRSTERGSEAALQASAPMSIFGPFGGSQVGPQGITQSLSPELQQQFGLFSNIAGGGGQMFGADPSTIRFLQGRISNLMESPGQRLEQMEMDRLQTLRERAMPFEEQLRQQTRADLFNRGRLGLGIQGGVTGGFSQPELAALEEGLARADLARQESARSFAEQTRASRLAEASGLLSQFAGLGAQDLRSQIAASQAALGLLRPGMTATGLSLQSRTPQGIAAMQAEPFAQQARGVESFFAGLGSQVAQPGFFGSIFNPDPFSGTGPGPA